MLNIGWQIDSRKPQPLYLQLYEQLKEAIIANILPANSRLPAIREMAANLSLSKNTVEAAYRQLEMEGYIYAQPKKGFFTAVIKNDAWRQERPQPAITADTNGPSPIRYDFGNNYIDRDSFDFNRWRKYLNQSLQYDGELFCDYGDPMGAYPLREQLAAYLGRSRQVHCTPEQIVIGAGTQVLLNLLCVLLKNTQSTIAFEEPGFHYGRRVFLDHGFQVSPIPLESDGLSLTALAASGATLVYVSPSNQFPTGAVMPISKRLALLAWSQANHGLIIEDDYDSELRYFGRPLPSLQGLDTAGSVIYTGSFSKILLPALRVAYMVLPPRLLPILRDTIPDYNQTASLIEQMTLARYMADGQLDRQIRRVRKIYARKNQLLLEQLQEKMAGRISILGKETGLHVLLELDTNKDLETIVRQAGAIGIKVASLSDYSLAPASQQTSHPLIILGYGGIRLEEIPPAIDQLAKAWFEI